MQLRDGRTDMIWLLPLTLNRDDLQDFCEKRCPPATPRRRRHPPLGDTAQRRIKRCHPLRRHPATQPRPRSPIPRAASGGRNDEDRDIRPGSSAPGPWPPCAAMHRPRPRSTTHCADRPRSPRVAILTVLDCSTPDRLDDTDHDDGKEGTPTSGRADLSPATPARTVMARTQAVREPTPTRATGVSRATPTTTSKAADPISWPHPTSWCFRRFPLVGLGCREAVAEGDRESVDRGLPPHPPSCPSLPGWVQ